MVSIELWLTSVYMYVAFDSCFVRTSIDLNLNPSCVWKNKNPAVLSSDLSGTDFAANHTKIVNGFLKFPINL